MLLDNPDHMIELFAENLLWGNITLNTQEVRNDMKTMTKFSEEVRERNKVTIEPVTIDSCRFCHGMNIKKYGIRKNKHTAIQRFLCSDCHKTFSMNLGFEKMKHNPKGITTAMQLYFS